jgi:hypothetical protein
MTRTHDATGRTRTGSGDIGVAANSGTPRKKNKIAGQFAWQLIEMLESPAWCVLSLSARRLLNRIEIEHASHGGRENGKLPVTFDDFQNYGIDRHAIALAMREVEALGFVEVTVRGRAADAAEHRAPNRFRLTYQPTDKSKPTDEWTRIATIKEAEQIAATARKPIKRAKRKKVAAEKHSPVLVSANFSDGNQHRKTKSPVLETNTTELAETPTTIYSLGEHGSAAVAGLPMRQARRQH